MYYYSADNIDFVAYNQKVIQVITSYMSSMRFIMENIKNRDNNPEFE
jgi:hypothetical protein